jgi:hypothetical protein
MVPFFFWIMLDVLLDVMGKRTGFLDLNRFVIGGI